jgi:hypothetical protein
MFAQKLAQSRAFAISPRRNVARQANHTKTRASHPVWRDADSRFSFANRSV